MKCTNVYFLSLFLLSLAASSLPLLVSATDIDTSSSHPHTRGGASKITESLTNQAATEEETSDADAAELVDSQHEHVTPHLRAANTNTQLNFLEGETGHGDTKRDLQVCGSPCTFSNECSNFGLCQTCNGSVCINSNRCNTYCQTNSDCASSTDGCKYCSSNNRCQNYFSSGAGSAGWDGISCVSSYEFLQTALNTLDSGSNTIKICANANILVSGSNSMLTSGRSFVTLQCEETFGAGNSCTIRRTNGTGRLMTFFGRNISLRGITFVGGSTVAISGGGAVYIQGSNNVIDKCIFVDNTSAANGAGGAASIGGGTVTSLFGTGNSATSSCNGIFVRNSNQCFNTPGDDVDNSNRNFGTGGLFGASLTNPNDTCGHQCFSDRNCARPGAGSCTDCDNFGKCVDPNANSNRSFNAAAQQCGQFCTQNLQCGGLCNTCDLFRYQCYNPNQATVNSNRNGLTGITAACIRTELELTAALQDFSSTGPANPVELCTGANIVLSQEIISNVNNKVLTCQGGQRTCTIRRSSFDAFRLLTFGGNNVQISHINFIGGKAPMGSNGGALLLTGNNSRITSCLFNSNRAGDRGGAISMRDGVLSGNRSSNNNARQCSNVYYASQGNCGNIV